MELRDSEGESQCEDVLVKAEVGTRRGAWDSLPIRRDELSFGGAVR
jgi:hypothetical protein